MSLPRYPHDPDTWWHISFGERILETGRWPTTENYSFTARGEEWIDSEWLGEVVMAAAARLGGLRGLAVLRVALASAFLLLLYYYSLMRSGNPKAAFVALVVLSLLTTGFLWLRPQLLAYSFLAITLICLERFRQGSLKALWILPPVFLLWVNTHPTFPLGLMAMGVYWASGLVSFRWGGLEASAWKPPQRRYLLLISLLCVLVLPVSPYGARLAAYPLEFSYSHSDALARLGEWSPLNFGEPWGKQVLVLILAFLLAQVVFRPRYRLEEMALLLFALYVTGVHRRFFLLFVSVFAPILAELLAPWIPRDEPRQDRYALNASLVAVVVAALVWTFPSHKELQEVVDATCPRQAAEYIRQHAELGRMYNDYWMGGYLIWSLAPERPVFIDGRTDVYENAGVFSDYFNITSVQPNALMLLRKYNVQSCITGRSEPLAAFLARLPDWQLVYKDNLSIIFLRKQEPVPTHAVLAPSYPQPH